MHIFALLFLQFWNFQHTVIERFLYNTFATSTASSVDSLFGINDKSKKIDTNTKVFLSKTYQNIQNNKLSIQ